MSSRPVVYASLAILLSLGVVAHAAPARPAAAKADPKAQAMLTQMAAAYQSLRSFSCTIQVEDGGRRTTQTRVRFLRPNLASVQTSGASGLLEEVVGDGSHISQVGGGGKKYQVAAMPAGQAVPAILSASGDPLVQLIANPQAILSELLPSATLGLAQMVGATPANTVVVNIPPERITFALGKKDHLIRRLAFTVVSPGGQPSQSHVETVTALNAAPALVASNFTFTAPAGAEKVDSLEPPMYDPRLKVGAAPFPITASDLDGNPVSLDDYKGKVVMLDFWATWCGPCVGEMPNVVAAYHKYHAQGFDVVGISLDQAGDKAKLTAFTQKNTMPWRQVYDGGGWQSKVAQQYGVQAIPFSLLIGKDGKIAAVGARGPELAPAIESALAQK